jgi:hypothetical protein
MSRLLNWLSPFFSRLPRRGYPAARPTLEHLETRQLLSMNVVASACDPAGEPVVFAVVSSDNNNLWMWNPQISPGAPTPYHWVKLTTASVSEISASRNSAGEPVVFATIGSDSNTLWEWNPRISPGAPTPYHWAELSTGSFAQISAARNSAGEPVVFGTVASAGDSLWEWNPQTSPGAPTPFHWAELTGDVVGQISATQNSTGDAAVFATFSDASNALWMFNPQVNPGGPTWTHWVELTAESVAEIGATRNSGGDAVVFATIASARYSLWEWNPQIGPAAPTPFHWSELTAEPVGQISATQNSTGDAAVFVTISSAKDSLWEFNSQINPGAPTPFHWAELSPASFSQVSATRDPAGDAVVFAAVASDHNSLWDYDPRIPTPTHWTKLTTATI